MSATSKAGAPVSLRKRIRPVGAPLLGTFLGLGSALAAEACAIGGFDWLLADLEHGGSGEEALLGQIYGAGIHGVPVIARVETASRIRAGRVLDLGAAGVMFPRLNTVAEVEQAVGHLRYPPAGDRGVATYHRACGFGLRPETLDTANDDVVSIVQIETAPALEHVHEIAAVPGVDVLFVGPRDLSHALGCPGDIDAPVFQTALRRVVDAVSTAGIAAGILAPDAERARRYAELGFTFIGIASDSTFVANAARATTVALAAPDA